MPPPHELVRPMSDYIGLLHGQQPSTPMTSHDRSRHPCQTQALMADPVLKNKFKYFRQLDNKIHVNIEYTTTGAEILIFDTNLNTVIRFNKIQFDALMLIGRELQEHRNELDDMMSFDCKDDELLIDGAMHCGY
jgi:hypothetical protein